MEFCELLADFERHRGRPLRLHGVLRAQHFGQAAPIHELHGHEEVAVQVSEIVDLHYARVYAAQLLLYGRAAALRFDDELRGAVRPRLD